MPDPSDRDQEIQDQIKRRKESKHDPKVYRKELWEWLSNGTRGGELGRFVKQFIERQNLRKRSLKFLRSRVSRPVSVILIIGAIGVSLKKGQEDSVIETVFDNLESIALGSAGIIFLLEGRDCRKKDHYEAWQVINSAQGQTGSGGASRH